MWARLNEPKKLRPSKRNFLKRPFLSTPFINNVSNLKPLKTNLSDMPRNQRFST